MSENIIEFNGGTVIMNGGDPLDGCPESWEQAKKITEKLNEGSGEYDPQWGFDCGFKLDFDGDLLSVSSRFYPPKTHYGPTWDGKVHFVWMGEKIITKHFDCATLDDLSQQVTEYVKGVASQIKALIDNGIIKA